MRRRLCVIGLVAVIVLTRSGAPQGQAPTSQPRVWTGTWEEHDAWEGHSKYGRKQAQISFVYVQGRDEFGLPRWDSRRLTWNAVWEEHSFDTVALWEGPPDDRGFTMRRYRQDIDTYCTGGGTLELGPNLDDDALTPEQQAHLRPTCVTTYHPRDGSVPTPAPTTSSGDELPAPSLPNEDQLTGCAYEKSWPKGGRPAGSFSVSVSTPVTAVMEVSRRADEPYAQFVPSPGAPLVFTASVSSGTARFRFELDPEATSHFPGYATNANVDAAFLSRQGLGNSPTPYANDGPDVIFHPKHHSAQEWSRVEPLVVETARPQSAASVTVTTLDYGAVSRLRAFVKSEDCGDWQPVPVKFYPDTREFVAIPMDEDHNLMADALDDYAGRESGVDDDAEPKGNGMAGDGLTAFEEYRGFLTSSGDCVNRTPDRHVRTRATVKDLFVHTPDPEIEMALEHTAWSSGLNIHAICKEDYSGNPEVSWFAPSRGDLGTHAIDRTRIVNMTLQFAGLRQWQNHVISQAMPQHGLYAVSRELKGFGGYAFGDDFPEYGDTSIGPPMITSIIVVNKESNGTPGSLVSTVTHEVGHGVGLPHHGQRIETWHLQTIVKNIKQAAGEHILVAPGGDCVEPAEGVKTEFNYFFQNGKFLGCSSRQIILRGGENSGNAECPMRYSSGWNFRAAPGSQASAPRSPVYADEEQSWTGARRGISNIFQALVYSGRFLKYDNTLDHEALGRMCFLNTGTELNALPGDQNHAGDSQVACMDQLVVNDNVLRGIR